jgi:hypothetical protein
MPAVNLAAKFYNLTGCIIEIIQILGIIYRIGHIIEINAFICIVTHSINCAGKLVNADISIAGSVGDFFCGNKRSAPGKENAE